jgi:hypothetical protein
MNRSNFEQTSVEKLTGSLRNPNSTGPVAPHFRNRFAFVHPLTGLARDVSLVDRNCEIRSQRLAEASTTWEATKAAIKLNLSGRPVPIP